MHSTTKKFRPNFNAVQFWTDSTTALAWVNSPEKQKFYCANRITIILSDCEAQEWHHIPGERNPADHATTVSRYITWNNFGCNHRNFYSYQNLIGLHQRYKMTQLLTPFSPLQIRRELLH